MKGQTASRASVVRIDEMLNVAAVRRRALPTGSQVEGPSTRRGLPGSLRPPYGRGRPG